MRYICTMVITYSFLCSGEKDYEKDKKPMKPPSPGILSQYLFLFPFTIIIIALSISQHYPFFIMIGNCSISHWPDLQDCYEKAPTAATSLATGPVYKLFGEVVSMCWAPCRPLCQSFFSPSDTGTFLLTKKNSTIDVPSRIYKKGSQFMWIWVSKHQDWNDLIYFLLSDSLGPSKKALS